MSRHWFRVKIQTSHDGVCIQEHYIDAFTQHEAFLMLLGILFYRNTEEKVLSIDVLQDGGTFSGR